MVRPLNVNGHAVVPDISEGPELSARVFIAISPALLEMIDDYRFSKRHRSQSSAVRKLLELGLEAAGHYKANGTKPHA